MVEKTVIAKFTVTANAAANSIFPVYFIKDPQTGEENQLAVPKGRRYVVKDIYVKEAPSIDSVVYFYLNGETLVLSTDPLSTLVESNVSRPRYAPITLDEFSSLTAKALNLDKGGTADTEITFYIKIDDVPAVGPSPTASKGGVLDKLRAAIAG